MLFALSSKHSLGLESWFREQKQEGQDKKNGKEKKDGRFMGVHLRSGKDAENAGRTDIQTQAGNYVSLAREKGWR